MGAFWMWNEKGWLYKLGALDNAGGVVVHAVGGSAALVAAYLAGPRHGRYAHVAGEVRDRGIDPHSAVLQAMGCILLYTGWLSFNGSSLYSGGSIDLVNLATRNTLLAGSAGYVTAFAYALSQPDLVYPKRRKFLVPSLTGALSGLAGITSNCGVVSGWASLVIGAICAMASAKASDMLPASRWRIDDPVDAIPVHLVAGSIGMILTGLFAIPEHVATLRGEDAPAGLFYAPYSGVLLGCQLLSVVVYVVWSTGHAYLALRTTKYFAKAEFTYSKAAQLLGLDHSLHGGVAYPDFTFVNIKRTRPRQQQHDQQQHDQQQHDQQQHDQQQQQEEEEDRSRRQQQQRQQQLQQQQEEHEQEQQQLRNAGSSGELRHRSTASSGASKDHHVAVEMTQTNIVHDYASSTNNSSSTAIEEQPVDYASSGDSGGGSSSSSSSSTGIGGGGSDGSGGVSGGSGSGGGGSSSSSDNTADIVLNPVPVTRVALITQHLRIGNEDSVARRHALPINLLDEIMGTKEKRCVVVMSGLKVRYSLAAIQREVDREFTGDYNLIAVAPGPNLIVVELKSPLIVMRFAAQFKIERWSDPPTASTRVTDSGTIIEVEAPQVEYCKIQDRSELVDFFGTFSIPYSIDTI